MRLSSLEGLDGGNCTMGRSARGHLALLGRRCQPGLGHGPGLPGVVGTCAMGEGKKGFWGSNPFDPPECEVFGKIGDSSIPGEG